jgi:hypothetical protein
MPKAKGRGRFQKGESGNPAGRPPKDETFTAILYRKLDEVSQGGKTRKEYIIERLIDMAEKGELSAIKYLMDRLEGTPTARAEMIPPPHYHITFGDELIGL